MANKLFSHRPGLDGIRGIGMFTFMLWHVGAISNLLPGTWLVVNAFFVLSAFLITRLLLAERRQFGNISIREFYARRVRRLAPALLVMLTAVTIDGIFFAPQTETRYLKGDILSTLFYVMNWRLVTRGDQYFEGLTHPSITRPAWTLSVEEQFYILVPLLLIAVLTYLSRRFSRTMPFIVLALASAAWATTVDLSTLTGQAHAYYGTDIRVEALALGAAAGMWTGHVGRGAALLKPKDRRDGFARRRPMLEAVGWAGFLGTVIAATFVHPLDSWMYSRGGMLFTSVLALGWVLGCAQQSGSLLVRFHSWVPVLYTGKISYGLYLFHWPIYIWLARAFPEASVWGLAVGTLLLSYIAASLSFYFLEQPIMRRGWKAFGARSTRALAAASSAFIIGGALTLSGSAMSAEDKVRNVPQYVPDVPQLVSGQLPYREPSPPAKIAMFGDSVPYFLVERIPHQNFPGLDVVNLATPGCDLLDQPMQRGSIAQQNDSSCKEGKRTFEQRLRASKAQTVVIMGSLLLGIPHQVDGKVLWLDSPQYQKLVADKLTQFTHEAHAAGVKHVLVTTVPCRGEAQLRAPLQYLSGDTNQQGLMAEATHPNKINGIITGWAQSEKVPVVDLAAPICGKSYQPALHGKTLYDDGVHFSPEATPMVWKWLAPQIVSKAGLQ